VTAPCQPAANRALARLTELFEIGRAKGANRPGLSQAEQRAHELATRWMTEAGLVVSVDAAGNLIGRAAGTTPGLAEVWTGSHLDTVPDGGRFDGALGVVAGLEAVAAAAARPRARTLAVVAFRDEEGWRFGQGYFGSRALCGQVTAGQLDARDVTGTSIRQALSALGLAYDGGPTGPLPGMFVELHIEQGTQLAERGQPVGVVSDIVAMAGMTIRFLGERAHAGGAAMARRHDALAAAAHFVVAARSLALADPRWRATVGQLTVSEPAANVVAGEVTARIDARARSGGALDSLLARLREAAGAAAAEAGCTCETALAWRQPGAAMSETVTRVLAGAAGTGEETLVSWAGHDTSVLRSAGVDTGMLFVRAGRGGISHSPDETATGADIAAGINALATGLGGLADQS
jgi:hydantoinase/carbamoylase family amidase